MQCFAAHCYAAKSSSATVTGIFIYHDNYATSRYCRNRTAFHIYLVHYIVYCSPFYAFRRLTVTNYTIYLSVLNSFSLSGCNIWSLVLFQLFAQANNLCIFSDRFNQISIYHSRRLKAHNSIELYFNTKYFLPVADSHVSNAYKFFCIKKSVGFISLEGGNINVMLNCQYTAWCTYHLSPANKYICYE